MKQESFWGVIDYPDNEAAKQARDARYAELKRQGKRPKRSVLTNQLRKWASLGVEDGRSGNVYYLAY